MVTINNKTIYLKVIVRRGLSQNMVDFVYRPWRLEGSLGKVRELKYRIEINNLRNKTYFYLKIKNKLNYKSI